MLNHKTFLLDGDTRITYSDFLSFLKSSPRVRKFCKAKSLLEYFSQITLALLADAEITLFDSDLSSKEIKNLIPQTENLNEEIKVENIPEVEKFIESLQNAKNFSITLFTSGTTGRPKKVTHSFDTLNRFAKIKESRNDDIWGFAYNPSHIAGLQIFFQALLNGNTIVNFFEKSGDEILQLAREEKVSHISATPTFYRMLPSDSTPIYSVKRLSSGGERFDSRVFEKLSKTFPNASIANFYASTEVGSLLFSNNDTFSIKDEIKNLVKIENGELLVKKSMLGKTELLDDDIWYKTGDLVEIVSENPLKFKFVARESSMINTGGYKVNPEEVEEAIRAIDGVKQARVFAMKNSILGNIVCAEIESNSPELDERTIKTKLKKSLQDFKIPRIIKFAMSIACTKTGKTDRKL